MFNADKHFHADADDLRTYTVTICSEGWDRAPTLRWEETRDEAGNLTSVRPEFPCFLKFTPKT